jgi:hypothetical protein
VLSKFIETGRVGQGIEREFLSELQEKYPYTKEACKKCEFCERTEPQTSMNNKLEDNTPLFGIRPRNSTFQHSEYSEHEPKKRRSSANFNFIQRGIGASMDMEDH